jgi:hypothetical protein
MHIFFDVDYTILGGWDNSLRPGTHDVFTRLRDDGHDVYVWSGEGVRWGVVRSFELEELVSGVYGKPLSDYRRRLTEFEVPVVPDFVIDDYSGIVRCFGGVWIPEYLGESHASARGQEPDDALETVYDVIQLVAAGETPEHPRYFAGGE